MGGDVFPAARTTIGFLPRFYKADTHGRLDERGSEKEMVAGQGFEPRTKGL